MTALSTFLASGFVLPFVVEVPKDPGFLKVEAAELTVEVGESGRRDGEEIAAVLAHFGSLAATGALNARKSDGDGAPIEFSAFEALTGGLFRSRISRAALDDRAMVVLAHLFLMSSAKVDIRMVSLVVPDFLERAQIGRSRGERSTYPAACSPLPFHLEDEEPEGDAITFDIAFANRPGPGLMELLDHRFETWAEAIRKGAYALALLGPEPSHVESYDESFTAIGRHAERSYHKLNADDGAVDAALNILVALHRQGHTVDTLRIA